MNFQIPGKNLIPSLSKMFCKSIEVFIYRRPKLLKPSRNLSWSYLSPTCTRNGGGSGGDGDDGGDDGDGDGDGDDGDLQQHPPHHLMLHSSNVQHSSPLLLYLYDDHVLKFTCRRSWWEFLVLYLWLHFEHFWAIAIVSEKLISFCRQIRRAMMVDERWGLTNGCESSPTSSSSSPTHKEWTWSQIFWPDSTFHLWYKG